jgi:hypothetical protein
VPCGIRAPARCGRRRWRLRHRVGPADRRSSDKGTRLSAAVRSGASQPPVAARRG